MSCRDGKSKVLLYSSNTCPFVCSMGPDCISQSSTRKHFRDTNNGIDSDRSYLSRYLMSCSCIPWEGKYTHTQMSTCSLYVGDRHAGTRQLSCPCAFCLSFFCGAVGLGTVTPSPEGGGLVKICTDTSVLALLPSLEKSCPSLSYHCIHFVLRDSPLPQTTLSWWGRSCISSHLPPFSP